MGMVIDFIIDFLAQGELTHILLEKGSSEIALEQLTCLFK